MTKLDRRKHRGPFPWRVHPIWRGIGCLLMVIVPVISWSLVSWLLPLLEEPLPAFFTIGVILPGVGEIENFYARSVLAIFFTIPIFLLFSILGSILYSLLGGDRNEKVAMSTQRDPYKR